MKLRKLLLVLLVVGMTPSNAEDAGSIEGTVLGPYDEKVRYAPIQATNVETGLKVRAQSGPEQFPR